MKQTCLGCKKEFEEFKVKRPNRRTRLIGKYSRSFLSSYCKECNEKL